MPDTPCVLHCGRPADGYFVCHPCAEDLAAALADVPMLLAELTTNETRSARYGDPVAGGQPTVASPLPYDPGAADTRDALINAVVTWGRVVAEHCGEAANVGTVADLAYWVRARVHRVRAHPAGGELVTDLIGVIRRSSRVVDRAAGKIYVGPCGAECGGATCPADIYARADPDRPGALDPRQRAVRCRACGTEWDAGQRREWLLGELRETLATAHEIASAAGTLAGRQINVHTIRTWATRGLIAAYGARPPRYRIGEVIDRATFPTRRAAG